MLRCNIQFEQLGRSLGCYVPTAISINFQDTMHATVHHCYVVTSISSNFEDALDVTFQETFQLTYAPKSPPKGSPVPLNAPLSPGKPLKG